MTNRLARKLLIVGWDAADWKMIGGLLGRGEMPNVRRLIDGGVHTDLATLEPRLSPLLWTSIATGKTADKHGILHFIEPNAAGTDVRVSSSTSRKTKALWNILTQSGMRVNVVSWYASHPAEPINGTCVSNLFLEAAPASSREPWPLPDGAVHPAAAAQRIAKQRLHPAQVSQEMLRPLVSKIAKVDRKDPHFKELARHVAQCHSVHRSALAILSDDQAWDCTMVFYDTIDVIGHHFMQFHPPRMAHVTERDFDLYHDVMNSVYRLQDSMLGELLKKAGPETTVILLSDHGFYCDELRPSHIDLPPEQHAAIEAMWHRPYGVLMMAGPGFKRGERLYGANILDITPTALTLLGLPVGMDMDGRVLTESFDCNVEIKSNLSWDQTAGDAGMHPAEMRLDPFESHDAVKQLIDLGYMAALPQDAQSKLDLTRRETKFNLAVVYMTTARPDKAIPIYDELIQQNSDEARFVLGKARCLFMCGRLQECAATLRPYLERHPDSIEARLLLAGTLGLLQDGEAAEHLRLVENGKGNRRDLLIPLGDVYSSMNRWTEAERHYSEVLQMDANNPQVLHGMARAAIAQQKFDDAVDYCLRAVEHQHVFPEAHHLLGVALTWLKDYEHAIKSFNVAVSMQPGLLDAHRFLASIYRHLGDRENAAKHRVVAEKLISDIDKGVISPEFAKREAPMGPQEWASRIGLGSATESA